LKLYASSAYSQGQESDESALHVYTYKKNLSAAPMDISINKLTTTTNVSFLQQ